MHVRILLRRERKTFFMKMMRYVIKIYYYALNMILQTRRESIWEFFISNFSVLRFLLQISFSTFSTIKRAFFSLSLKCAYFKHLFYAKYRHKIIKKMCFWGNERQSKRKIKSLKAMAFLYAVASICESSISYMVKQSVSSLRFIGALILSQIYSHKWH